LTGVAALRAGFNFVRDPLVEMRRLYDAYGQCVFMANALPFPRSPPVVLLNVPLILTAGAAFNLEVLNNPATWRPVSLMPGGPRNSAARRLSDGLMRMTGRRHAHYRKLVSAPLRKDRVEAFDADMVRLAQEEVAKWRVGETLDLWQILYRLTRRLAIGLLFGGDHERGFPIADMIASLLQRKWAPSVIGFPIDLPITPYGRVVREAEALERRILRWAESKRGRLDSNDLASIVVNSPDVDGNPTSSATIAGQIPTLFAATAEACQATLFWALLLLAQHPRVASDLLDELHQQPRVPDTLGDLPRLDAVVKETMRILPPVPLQIRAAQHETTIAGYLVPKGARLVLSAFLTNRLPALYPAADSFRPERWSTINPTSFEYMVFSSGPRSCPGFRFGARLLRVALAAILTRFRVELGSEARIDYAVQPTLRPLGRVPVVLHAQDGAFAAAPVRGSIRNLVRFPH
jgi:cytochrome P450